MLALWIPVFGSPDSTESALAPPGTVAGADSTRAGAVLASAIDTLVPADAPWLAEMDDSTAGAGRDTAIAGARPQRTGAREIAQNAAVRLSRAVAAWPATRWLRRHALRLLLTAVSITAIWLALAYFGARREQERFLTTTRLSIMDKEVQRACRLVESGYADPGLTPQSLCAQLVTGESFLESLYQRELGMSVAEFIEQVRINRVRQLLRLHPLMPVSELAAATGFGAADDLSRAFERVAGTGIERYREALQAGEEPAA